MLRVNTLKFVICLMIRSLSTLPYRAATLHRYTTTKMKRIVPIGFILFGFILLNIKVADCITCLKCHNIADLSNCKEAMVCNANQTCFIEKILSPVDFKPVYNTGCRDMEYCKLQLCNKNAYGDGNSRKKRVDNDLTLCSECCFEDSCNAEGCGYKQPTNNITQCFKCDEVYEGGPQCTTTEDCDLTLFSCSVTNHPHSNKPGAYELGCQFKRAQCRKLVELIGDQRDKNVQCCDTTLCNPSPYNRKINKTVIEHDFKCPEGIIRPTTKPPLPPPTTTFPAPTKPSTLTVSPTFDSHTPPTIASTSFSTSTPNVTQSSTPPPPTTTTSLPTTESTVPTTTTTTVPTTKSTVPTTSTTTQPTTKSTVPTTTTTTLPTTKSTVPTTTTTTQPTTKATVKTTTTTTVPTTKLTVPTTTTTTVPTTKSTVPTTTTTTLPTTKSTVPTTSTTTVPTTKSTVPTTTSTTLPTTKTTTPVPTTKTTTTLAASTGVPPKTIPPVTTMCAVCSGPKFLCEKLFAPTPCAPPNNYCINSITNHLDGTKTVERSCGNFDTCYREWFEGSSDDDKCRDFDGNDQQFLDFHCTFCCTTDNCNTPLHPSQDSLYKPV